MSTDPLHDLIEIDDPEIDPAQIMGQIRERIRRRRTEMGYDRPAFPTFGAAAYPGEPGEVGYDADLYHHLWLLNKEYAQIETTPNLASSPATRLPIIGSLWQKVRGQVHALVLFYVNRAVIHQAHVNRHLVNVLNRMTLLYQTQQQTISALQSEVEKLRQQGQR